MNSKTDYDGFKAQDFLLDKSFQRYCLGNDDAARKFWEGWLFAHAEKRGEVETAKALYYVINGGNDLESFEANRLAFRNRLIKEGILAEREEVPVVQMPVQQKAERRIPLFKMIAAAAALLMISAGLFFILSQKTQDTGIAVTPARKAIDKAPGGDKAILTLADGRQIILDTASNGALVQQGGIKVIKAGGQLTYDVQGASAEVLYNTITTPRGGQYQLELADGSKVWLNSASSLRFPASFAGEDRTVELTGEGYFEVSHNPGRPFHVKAGQMDVRVLGTHFNINSYQDEPAVETTLLQGKVRVTKGEAYLNLNPGQQAVVVPSDDNIKVEYKADVEAATAWKNGLIYFDGADVGAVMRQIARWYDVEVEYNGNIKAAHLSGKVSRSLNLSQVINVLEELGIDVKTEGAKLVATPKP